MGSDMSCKWIDYNLQEHRKLSFARPRREASGRTKDSMPFPDQLLARALSPFASLHLPFFLLGKLRQLKPGLH